MTDSPFGPVRKFGRMDPNVYHELEDIAHWQSIMDALGDVCVDTGVIHEPSAAERDMAMLTATFPELASPTNTVALTTAPVIPDRNQFFRGVMFALWITVGAGVLVAAAIRGLTS